MTATSDATPGAVPGAVPGATPGAGPGPALPAPVVPRQSRPRRAADGEPPAAATDPAAVDPAAVSDDVRQALYDAGVRALGPLVVVRAPSPGASLEAAQVVWVNRSAVELLRADEHELLGRPFGRLVEPAVAGEFRPPLLRTERVAEAPVVLATADGSRVEAQLRTLPSPTTGLWTVSIFRTGTAAERAAQEQLSAQERRLAALVARSPVPTVVSEVGLRLAHVNDAFCALLGADEEDLLGTRWMGRVHPEDLEVVLGCAEQVLSGDPAEATARLVRTDGQARWVHLLLAPTSTPAQGAGFVGTAEDVTERRAFEEALSHQARHDALTGLPNRTWLVDTMTERLRASRADGAGDGAVQRRRAGDPSPMTAVFLDLDNFKVVNDSLGHAAGDKLLVAVAERLRAVVRTEDVVARWGGDEFVVLCDGVPDDAAALALGEDVARRLREGLSVDGVAFSTTASIGVTRVTPEHATPEEVLQDCDIAMYAAKRAGRDRVALCDTSARSRAHEALLLTIDLREALAAEQLTVEYQPVLDLHDPGALPAVEALVRWYHPVRGTVPPELLVQTAEANGLIDVLGSYVLKEACRQMARWQAELGDLAPAKVNVNLSAIQLCDPRVVDEVADVLAETGIGAAALCLEVTETALVTDPALSRERLLRLRGMGVRIALDDFGTGYSSLAYLRQLPVDYLKVDRSFVAELDDGHPEVVSAVIGLARSLGLTSVAEGVEHPAQVAALRELGADLAQGWYYARAMDAGALARWRRGGSPAAGEERA